MCCHALSVKNAPEIEADEHLPAKLSQDSPSAQSLILVVELYESSSRRLAELIALLSPVFFFVRNRPHTGNIRRNISLVCCFSSRCRPNG